MNLLFVQGLEPVKEFFPTRNPLVGASEPEEEGPRDKYTDQQRTFLKILK